MRWKRERTIHRKTETLYKLFPPKSWWPTVFVLLLAAMGALSVLAYDRPFLPWDITVAHWIRSLPGGGDSEFMKVVSWPGIKSIMVITVLMATAWVTWVSGWRGGLHVLSLLLIMGVNEQFKEIVDRPRPGESESIENKGFPSGHALYAVLLSGVIWLFIVSKIRNLSFRATLLGVLISWPVLIGLSRISMEKHWPSDVLGSYLLGILVLIIMKWTIPTLERTRGPFSKHSIIKRKGS
tara:strand:+ start:482 stop:1195 length:714 start_codon:yes stop_codon:yes gene_type:complete